MLTHQVIPQLVLSETPTPAPSARVKPRQGCSLGAQAPEADARFPDLQTAAKALAEMAMDNNAGGCWQLIHDLRREEDLSPEAVMLGLIQPAARCMGEGWMTDRCDFAGVTIGLWRLQQILNDLRLEVQQTAPQNESRVFEPGQPIPSIALATLPGSQEQPAGIGGLSNHERSSAALQSRSAAAAVLHLPMAPAALQAMDLTSLRAVLHELQPQLLPSRFEHKFLYSSFL